MGPAEEGLEERECRESKGACRGLSEHPGDRLGDREGKERGEEGNGAGKTALWVEDLTWLCSPGPWAVTQN